MNYAVILFATFAFSASIIENVAAEPLYNDFRVTYNVNPFGNFRRTARTMRQAMEDRWQLVSYNCTNDGSFNGLKFVDRNDTAVALLFDIHGVIAGVQALIPHREVLTPENTVRYGNIPMYQNITLEDGETYFVLTAYFISPEKVCGVGRLESDLEIEGTAQGLWLQNGPTPADFIQVPTNRQAANAEGWTMNQCFPGMGAHNFYQVDKFEEHGCNEVRPAFGLYNKNDTMHGFGLIVPGTATSKKFEYPPGLAIQAILGPPVPPCILEQNSLIGTTTLHVYFIDTPWSINCA